MWLSSLSAALKDAQIQAIYMEDDELVFSFNGEGEEDCEIYVSIVSTPVAGMGLTNIGTPSLKVTFGTGEDVELNP